MENRLEHPQIGRDRRHALDANRSASAIYNRKRGRKSREETAEDQQYLTTQEENILLKCFWHKVENRVRFLGSAVCEAAHLIRLQRHSTLPIRLENLSLGDVPFPGPNWKIGFSKRHGIRFPHSRASKKDGNKYCEASSWLEEMGTELDATKILSENMYYAVLVRGVLRPPSMISKIVNEHSVKRQVKVKCKAKYVTILECFNLNDGRCLSPLVVLPMESWGNARLELPEPSLGWQIEESENGHLDPKIVMNWVERVIEPQTKATAGTRARCLIGDCVMRHISSDIRENCEYKNINLYKASEQVARRLLYDAPANFNIDKIQATVEQIEQAYARFILRKNASVMRALRLARDEAFRVQKIGDEMRTRNVAASLPDSHNEDCYTASDDLTSDLTPTQGLKFN